MKSLFLTALACGVRVSELAAIVRSGILFLSYPSRALLPVNPGFLLGINASIVLSRLFRPWPGRILLLVRSLLFDCVSGSLRVPEIACLPTPRGVLAPQRRWRDFFRGH
jgi:hypothetical protein